MVYADNAATTQIYDTALKAMNSVYQNMCGNASSMHRDGIKAKELLEKARSSFALHLNAAASEIYFTSGGSEANTQAILSAANIGKLKGKRHIVSTPIEHHSVLNTLNHLKGEGFKITYLDVDSTGSVLPAQLRHILRQHSDVCLVSVMMVNNEIGTIEPIKELGEICHAWNVPFHVDAVQAAGHLLIDVQKDCIDFLSISAHKFHGPKGIGALFARGEYKLSNIIFGGGQERSYRPGTENVPSIVAMSVAFNESLNHCIENENHVTQMRNKLFLALHDIGGVTLNGSFINRMYNNINISFEGVEGESLVYMLSERGVYVSTGSACNSGSLEPSHVLLAIGIPPEKAFSSIRITLGDDVTEGDIQYIAESISECVNFLRSFNSDFE